MFILWLEYYESEKDCERKRYYKDSRGILFYPMFTCNENPSHPQGIGMYVGDYYPHKGGMYNLGRRVKDIMSLPKEVIRYIKWVTTT